MALLTLKTTSNDELFDRKAYLSSHPIGSIYGVFPCSLESRLGDVFATAILQAIAAEAKIPFNRIVVASNCHALLAIEYHTATLLRDLFGRAPALIAPSLHSINPLSSDLDRTTAKFVRLCQVEEREGEASQTSNVTEYRLSMDLANVPGEEREVSIIQSVDLSEFELAQIHRLHTLGESPWSNSNEGLSCFRQAHLGTILGSLGKALAVFRSHRPPRTIQEEKLQRLAFAVGLSNGKTPPDKDDLAFAATLPSSPETDILRNSCELLVQLVETFGTNDVFYGYVLDRRQGERLSEGKRRHCLAVNGAESAFSRRDVLESQRQSGDSLESKTILRERLLPLVAEGLLEETRKHAGRRPALYRFTERTVQIFNASDKYPSFWTACDRCDPLSSNDNPSSPTGGYVL